MVLGVETRKLSERYVNVSTTEFGDLSFSTSELGDGFYREWSAYAPTISKDGVIKLTGHSTYKNAILSGRYLKCFMSDDSKKEVGVRMIIVVKGTAGLGFGLCTGVGAAESTTCAPTAVIGFYSNRLHVTISDDGEPSRYNTICEETGCTNLYYGDQLSGFTFLNYTAFDLKAYFIRGLDSEGAHKLTYCRAELFINGQPADAMADEVTDETNDVFALFTEELRPFIHVYNGRSVWLKHLGVYL